MINELEFYKTASSQSEAHIRAYDTKAEILLAAVALTFDPLSKAGERVGLEAIRDLAFLCQFAFFMVVLILLAWVLAPIRAGGQTSAVYVKDAENISSPVYREQVASRDLGEDLAADVLRLASIRKIKHTRFNRALAALIFYFSVVFMYGLLGLLRHSTSISH